MATYHKLIFNSGIDNPSLQSYDVAYKVSAQTTPFSEVNGIMYAGANELPVKLGTITKLGSNFIIIKDMVAEPQANDLIMFAKNNSVNKSGIKGYYAEVKLKNNSTELVELFSIASEVSPSSK
jgi:hypothetical protein